MSKVVFSFLRPFSNNSAAIEFFLTLFKIKNKKLQSFVRNKFIKNNYKLSVTFTSVYKKFLFFNTFLSLFSLKTKIFKFEFAKYKLFFFFLKNIFYLNSFILWKNICYIPQKNKFLNTSFYSLFFFYYLSFRSFTSSSFILCKIKFYCNELFLVRRFTFKFFLKFGVFFHFNSIFLYFNPLVNTFLNTLYTINCKIKFTTFSNNTRLVLYSQFFFSKNFFFFYIYSLYVCFFQQELKKIFRQLLIAVKYKKKRYFLKKITKLLSKKDKKKLLRYYYKLSKKNITYVSSSGPFKYLKLIHKDQKKRILFYKVEKYKYLYNYIFSNSAYSFFFKNIRPFVFSKLNNFISVVKIRNLCILTGSSKSVLKKYKISRITFRDWSKTGSLHGILKI